MKILGITFTKKDITYLLAIIFSAFIYSVGLNSFVKSGNLFPGGFAGISRLSSIVLDDFFHIHISFSLIYWLLNAGTALFVWRRIGHKFILFSVIWFSLTSLFTGVLPVREITEDPLLISVFGGVINGIAIGISLRNNASSGGMDFIAIDLSSRLKRPTWNYIFAVNAVVLVVAGALYGWNQSLYSIIFQYVSKEIVNMMHQRYKLSRLQVITNQPDEISQAVFHHVRHGITKIHCYGQYSHQEHDMLMITVNTYQIPEVVSTIQSVDAKAFISVTSVDKIIGNYYQKPLE